MTVAYDAAGGSATNTGGGVDPISWTHTPVGTPAGVVVFVQNENGGSDVATVTYGGVGMTQDASSPITGGDAGTQKIWAYTLFAAIPAGAQTATVDLTGTSGGTNCRSITFTGATTLEAHNRGTLNATVADPTVTVVCTQDSTVVGALSAGVTTAGAVAVNGTTTAIMGVVDVGSVQHCFARLTANTSTTDGPGWTIVSDTQLGYAIAVTEVAAAPAFLPRRSPAVQLPAY